jgi:predicted transcriptional regulator
MIRNDETTIRLNVETKQNLDKFKQYKNESYNELIRKLIYIATKCEDEPKLSQKTIKEIKEARERIKKGELYTEAEAKKILGL